MDLTPSLGVSIYCRCGPKKNLNKILKKKGRHTKVRGGRGKGWRETEAERDMESQTQGHTHWWRETKNQEGTHTTHTHTHTHTHTRQSRPEKLGGEANEGSLK